MIAYLQKEIRAQRRNIGALKLSNLLQVDRFEEDLNISAARLKPPARPASQPSEPSPSLPIDEEQRDKLLEQIRAFRQRLRRDPSAP